MWSTGTGSEVMQRIAVPMIGGMISSTVLTLIVIPAIYGLVKGWGLPVSRGAAFGGMRDKAALGAASSRR
jgi:Cu(I)/Ag(I) efflux system membrane protein CusA/SilA